MFFVDSLLIFRVISLLLIQLSSKTYFLGLYLLFLRFIISVCMSYLNMLWYALIFFLVYVGGIMVLFFYIISLNSNPRVLKETRNLFSVLYFPIYLIFFFFLYIIFRKYGLIFTFSFASKFLEDSSYILFYSTKNIFLMFLGLYLIYVLFLVRVFRSKFKGSLRPVHLKF